MIQKKFWLVVLGIVLLLQMSCEGQDVDALNKGLLAKQSPPMKTAKIEPNSEIEVTYQIENEPKTIRVDDEGDIGLDPYGLNGPYGLDDPYAGYGPSAIPPPPLEPPIFPDEDDFFFEEAFFNDGPVEYVGACGNGVRQGNEQCDDGAKNGTEESNCNINCTLPSCGNGVTDIGEECDDGGNVSGDGCSSRCQFERCGDGKLDERPKFMGSEEMVWEECDDGNNKAGDGCSPGCLREYCGNGIIDPGEKFEDGTTGPGEQCDDGEENGTNGFCTEFCQLESAE